MSRLKQYDIRNYRVTKNRKWQDTEELYGEAKILDVRLYATEEPFENKYSTREADVMETMGAAGIQFQMPGGKPEWVTVPLPQAFGDILDGMACDIAEMAIDEILGSTEPYGTDFGGIDFESVGPYGADPDEGIPEEDLDDMTWDEEIWDEEMWDDCMCGISAIAGILVGSLSHYILEKYGKRLSTESMTSCISTAAKMVYAILEPIAEGLAEKWVEESLSEDMENEAATRTSPAPIIDIKGKIKP